jgi:hypothetical protein
MLDGYAPPEDAELVLESLGPQMIKRYAANLRAAAAGTMAENLILRLDKGKNGAAIWKVSTEAMEPAIVQIQRKRA